MPKRIRKIPWHNQSKANIVRGLPLTPNAGVEAHYSHDLYLLIHRMATEVQRAIERLFAGETATEYFAEDAVTLSNFLPVIVMDASISSQARILAAALRKKFDRLFADNAKGMAETMVQRSNKTANAALYSSIQKLSGGLSIPTTALQGPITEILQASIAENVALIKSIPQKYLTGVEGAMMRSITTGNGLQDLVPYLATSKGVTLRRARFIASDQTAKVFQNICTARMEKLGLDEFEWLHVASNHPRKTHVAMAGNIYKLSEGAYDKDVDRNVLPGELSGCRCKKIPVIKFGVQNV